VPLHRGRLPGLVGHDRSDTGLSWRSRQLPCEKMAPIPGSNVERTRGANWRALGTITISPPHSGLLVFFLRA
jgi:hypothetical protein